MPFVKGKAPRNTGKTHFKKGSTPWNKDKHNVVSEESRKRMGAHGISKPSPMTGKRHTEEAKKIISQKISLYRKGRPIPALRKPWSEARRKAQCEGSLRYLGGKYHLFWNYIRHQIYQRDSFKCQECGATNLKLHCHHIDYNKENNDFNNLISLCCSCHMKTNYRREDWLIHYTSKIK